MRRTAILALAMLALACARHGRGERGDAPASPTLAADAGVMEEPVDATSESDGGDADASDGGRELAGFPALLELLDGDEKLGFVSVPLGAREPRPIMIALHGGSDRPERACSAWRGVTDAHPFVVCPRGFGGRESRLGWRGASDTARRIARAVAATKQTFGDWVLDTKTMVLAGFSMGGSQVALLARTSPRTYRRIVVGDSAHDPRPALGFAPAWVDGGGERAIFLCTTSGCEPSMRAAARRVARAKAPARLNVAPTQVHALSDRVVQSMRRDWQWLVDGAEGWETYAAPSETSLPGRTESFDPN